MQIKNNSYTLFLYVLAVVFASSCTVAQRLEHKVASPSISHTSKTLRDKVKLEEERKIRQEMAITDSLSDEDQMVFGDSTNTVVGEDGEEMVKIDIAAISVTARSRTLPERNGMVEIDFLIMLPATLQGETQSLTITPRLLSANGDRDLEPLQIRGGLFSKLQERNYWRYTKYKSELERKYNYGPMSAKDSAKLISVFEEYVRYPYLDHTRLDSISKGQQMVTYHYRENVKVEADAKRMQIMVGGNVKALDGSVYDLPVDDTLQFNLSTMLAFVDNSERYLLKIVSKYAYVQDRNYINFKTGRANVIDTLGDNAEQIERVRSFMYGVLFQNEFVVDSIVLTAVSSPDGSLATNNRLAEERAHAMADYLRKEFDFPELDTILKVRWIGEDWDEFARVMAQFKDKIANYDKIMKIITKGGDKDRLEASIRRDYPTDYQFIRSNVYPLLRAVNFKYDMRRVGMIQDTIHTTELDTVYMRGVELLKARQYEEANEILYEARDQNSALALISLGLNRSAFEILLELEPTSEVEYLKAIVCSRLGKKKDGIEYFTNACILDPTLEYRGRLDPEITDIIDFNTFQSPNQY